MSLYKVEVFDKETGIWNSVRLRCAVQKGICGCIKRGKFDVCDIDVGRTLMILM